VARFVLGIAEAPGFPASSSSKATGYWFPRRERVMATAIFDAAAKFSNVIGVPPVARAVTGLGWRFDRIESVREIGGRVADRYLSL
jgi:MFS family permease